MKQSVINYQKIDNGIIQITMQDKLNKNTFSPDLIEQLIFSFQQVGKDLSAKVVILTGFDSYFASGGTKQELLDLHEGKIRFTDINIYRLALDCPIPVISAMQGHGLGGGLVLGLFADFVILSRESIYAANFMKYGFTPGMGATYILPQKLGLNLANEMLFSAHYYRGEELLKRGVPLMVLPRKEVMVKAHLQAEELAKKTRNSLILLKKHLNQSIYKELPKIIEQEQKMHEETFHTPEVKNNIQALFEN